VLEALSKMGQVTPGQVNMETQQAWNGRSRTTLRCPSVTRALLQSPHSTYLVMSMLAICMEDSLVWLLDEWQHGELAISALPSPKAISARSVCPRVERYQRIPLTSLFKHR